VKRENDKAQSGLPGVARRAKAGKRKRGPTPSPLNGERAGVRGENATWRAFARGRSSHATVLLLLLFLCRGALLAADNELTELEHKQGWLLLFDGQTTNGWMTSDRKPCRTPVEQGSLNPHKSGHYMLVHTQQWTQFLLALDFKISPNCNSGVFVRTASLTPRPGKDVGFNGIEIAIDDTKTAGYHDTGAIYDLVKPSRNAMKPVGEWNHLEVSCLGNRIEVVLNGDAVTRADLDLFVEPYKRPDGSAHKFDIAYKDHPLTGYIGLQDHGAPCWFKNIKLKPITP